MPGFGAQAALTILIPRPPTPILSDVPTPASTIEIFRVIRA